MTAQEALELWEAYGDCVSLAQLSPVIATDRRRETGHSVSQAPLPQTPDLGVWPMTWLKRRQRSAT